MTVKVFIKRKVPEGKEEELAVLLRRLRTLTLKRTGYVSGETLNRIDKPGESVVISTWQSIDHWREWVLTPERSEIQSEIDELLGQKTDYEIYQH